MLLLALVGFPALLGVLALFVSGHIARRVLLLGGALLQAALVAAVVRAGAPPTPGAWLALDAPGTLFLLLTTGLFLVVSVYAQGSLGAGEDGGAHANSGPKPVGTPRATGRADGANGAIASTGANRSTGSNRPAGLSAAEAANVAGRVTAAARALAASAAAMVGRESQVTAVAGVTAGAAATLAAPAAGTTSSSAVMSAPAPATVTASPRAPRRTAGARATSADRVYVACLFWFLAAMTLVTVSQHLGVLWVGVEATTLASAPLVYHHRDGQALEAAWKYLLLCSVGIALALLGTFLVALAAGGARAAVPLTVEALARAGHAGGLQRRLLAGAFIFLLVGYGTKVGLAPLHNWLPDAHSQAPAAASALLSGALLNVAFLALLRGWQICQAAGMEAFASRLFVFFGLLSLVLAVAFVVGQRDYKRLLAYSSMEHMGVMVLGVGVGGAATYGAMLHAVNHTMAKALLFLVAGNLLAVYGTRAVVGVRGALRRLPLSGGLWLAGFVALAGSPPFGLFVSEITILRGMLQQGRWAVAALYLAALAGVFAGMSSIVLRMAQGQPPEDGPRTRRESWWVVVPPLALAAGVLLLGLWIPAPLDRLLHAAAASLGGRP